MPTTILIVDDETDFLDKCGLALQLAGFECELCASAEDARTKFHSRFYDGIVCDILIPYAGVREGGLVLAREFSSKYPSSCIVMVSQFVTAKWVNQFAGLPNHAFAEKGPSVVEDLVQEVTRIARTKYAFVCTPFSPAFNDIYEAAIKPAVLACGFKCKRADEIEHNNGVIQVICEQIEEAHVIVADMTGKNPNVYYEVGYAHALNKDVVLLIQDIDDMPFDLRGFKHIVYDGLLAVLKKKLCDRLRAMNNG